MLTAVDGQSITYDNSGNPTSYYDGYRYEMEWTEGRKLASVTYNNKVTTFEYNHEGLRIKKTLHDGSYILYDIVDGVYVGETRYNASGSVAVYIRYILDEENAPVGISLWYPATGGWTDYHFVKNLQGDVLEVYKVSDGSLAASYTYDSWGNILSQSGDLATLNPFRYRSYYYDTQTWFYYLQSRYYDPAIGRFINADTFASTGQGLLGNNMFAYCNNDPIQHIDASGRYPLQTAFEFLDRWLTGDGSKQKFNERDQVTKKIKKSTQMQNAISNAVKQYKNGQTPEPGSLHFTPDNGGYELYLGIQHCSYSITITTETQTTGLWFWKKEKTRYVATVEVSDIYNFDELRDWNSFGSIANNIAYIYNRLGGGHDYEWTATFTQATKWETAL